MSDTQAKFWRLLGAALPDGYELVIDHRYANTGIARVQPADALASVARIDFGFQADYATLSIVPPLPTLHEAQPGYRPVGRLDDISNTTEVYADTPAKLQAVVDALAAAARDASAEAVRLAELER